MLSMMSMFFEICGFHKNKSRYPENETLFFLPIKKLITHQGLLYDKE